MYIKKKFNKKKKTFKGIEELLTSFRQESGSLLSRHYPPPINKFSRKILKNLKTFK